MTASRTVRAPRGREISCKGWPQEAALRMLMNNLDPEVAERPEDLVVYGGSGKAARSWDGVRRHRPRAARRSATTRRCWSNPASPWAIFRTHEWAPRVLIANAMLVPALGDVGGVLAARGDGADDVRADDGRLVDLHRHAGHPAGHVRDVRGGRAAALRRIAARPAGADGGPGRHGRRAAAGDHDERGRRAHRRSRSRADAPAPVDTAGSMRSPTTSTRRCALAAECGQGRGAYRSACWAMRPTSFPNSFARGVASMSSPIRRPRTIRWTATSPRDVALEEAPDLRRTDPDGYVRTIARVDGAALRGDGGAHAARRRRL